MFKFSSRVQIIILSVSFSLRLDIYYRRSKRRTELSVRYCDVKCLRITRPAVIMNYYGHICNFLLQTDPQAQMTYHSSSRALSLFLFRLESKIFPGAVHGHLESSHTRRTRTIYVELVRLNIFTEKISEVFTASLRDSYSQRNESKNSMFAVRCWKGHVIPPSTVLDEVLNGVQPNTAMPKPKKART